MGRDKLKFKPRRPFDIAAAFHYKLGAKRDGDTQSELLLRHRIDKATKAAFPDAQKRKEYIQALIEGLE